MSLYANARYVILTLSRSSQGLVGVPIVLLLLGVAAIPSVEEAPHLTEEPSTCQTERLQVSTSVTRSDSLSPFFQDFNDVLSSIPFRWLTVAYSSFSATVSSLSTFGSAFLVDLGFLTNERSASLCMGAIVLFSGVLGTCMCIVFSLSVRINLSSSLYSLLTISDLGGLCGGYLVTLAEKRSDLRSSGGLEEHNGYTLADNELSITSAKGREIETPPTGRINNGEPSDIQMKRLTDLHEVLQILLPVLAGSCAILCLTALTPSVSLFVSVVGLGLAALFSTQAGIKKNDSYKSVDSTMD